MSAPLRLHKLTARAAASISTPGRHNDGGNLFLAVDRSGARRWVFLYKFQKRQTEMGIGPFHLVTLAAARERAAECRAMLFRGLDPLAIKRGAMGSAKAASIVASGRRTFGQCADDYIASHASEWKSAKHLYQWKATLGDPCRAIRDLPVADIDKAAVLTVLTPLWEATPETASRLRGRIEKVLAFATAKEWRTGDNPAAWANNLEMILPRRMKASKGRHEAMPWQSCPAFVASLDASVPAMALKFLILTASRVGEVLGARWQEIDLDARVWSIPGSRMKAGLDHVVPLSQLAIDLLGRMAAVRKGDLVFPGHVSKRPISDSTIRLLKADGYSIHGFRSSFRDWAAETEVSREIAESCLAHSIGNAVEMAYKRTKFLEQRRVVMQSWSLFLEHGK